MSLFGTRRFRIWAFFVMLVALHQLLQKVLDIAVPFLDNYLDALLFLPIVLQLIEWERHYLFRQKNYKLGPTEVIIYFFVLSFVAEYLFPRWRAGFTADWWDVLCYAIGAVVFLIMPGSRISAGKREG